MDADAQDLLSTCVSAETLKTGLKATPGRVILMLDACHSGGLDKARGRKRDSASLTDDLVRDLISDESGLIVMASSTGRESSLENNEHRRGNFSLALTEGLSGQADFNKDGTIYNHELDLYVTDRVKSLSKGRQHPVSEKPTSVRAFPLAKP